MTTIWLQGFRIAFLATDAFEQIELTVPWDARKKAGASVELVSPEPGKLVLPGGVFNPDALSTRDHSVDFIRDFFKQQKPVAAICHGPWMLVEAEVIRDRQLTLWPSLETDITNAGGRWLDEEV